jgi:hypothetical protein
MLLLYSLRLAQHVKWNNNNNILYFLVKYKAIIEKYFNFLIKIL